MLGPILAFFTKADSARMSRDDGITPYVDKCYIEICVPFGPIMSRKQLKRAWCFLDLIIKPALKELHNVIHCEAPLRLETMRARLSHG
jgi:hypothetical protein